MIDYYYYLIKTKSLCKKKGFLLDIDSHFKTYYFEENIGKRN